MEEKKIPVVAVIRYATGSNSKSEVAQRGTYLEGTSIEGLVDLMETHFKSRNKAVTKFEIMTIHEDVVDGKEIYKTPGHHTW